MANNRLNLQCHRCGSTVTIARLQVGMGSEWLPSRVSPEEYEAWLKEHSHCGEDPEAGLWVGLDCENTEALAIDRNP